MPSRSQLIGLRCRALAWLLVPTVLALGEACSPSGLKFYTLTPCRIVDTRNPPGPNGGPALQPSEQRAFSLAGSCGVPSEAKAVSLNLTVTEPAAAGHLTLFPADAKRPLVSSINFAIGQTRANGAIVALGHSDRGELAVFNGANGSVHLILDVNGYFAE